MKRLSLAAATLALLAAVPLSAQDRVPLDEINATQRAVARFSNQSTGASATAYSGHVATAAQAPTDGTVRLQRSAMAQPIASNVVPAGFAEAKLADVRRRLYYEDADGSGQFSKDTAAFRYKVLMYGHGDEDGDGEPDPDAPIRARFEEFSTWYGDDERARALEAERILRDAIVAEPFNLALQEAMLDLYADRAAAEVQFIKQQLDALNQLQLGLSARRGSTGLDSILEEIGAWTGSEGILVRYRNVLDVYGQLLYDPYGVRMSEVDPTLSADAPHGYKIFRDLVPARDAFAAQYMDDTGAIDFVPASGSELPDYPKLYSGYRDLVMLMTLLRDYAQGLAEAARLHALAIDFQDPNDPLRAAAFDLITQGQQRLYVDGQILLGAFPGLTPSELEASGLRGAIDGWEEALKQLNEARQIIEGKRNPLGFQPDFLVLATGLQGSGGEFLDSYNALAGWVSTVTNPPSRPLAVAVADFERAQDRYTDFKGYEDQLAQQFNDVRTNFTQRAFALVGAVPGDPNYMPHAPVTGEIAEQFVSIQLAQAKIDHNKQEVANVEESINIEVERRGIEMGINEAINGIYVKYGDMRADLRDEIGNWKAAQAGAEAANSTLNNAFAAVALGPGAVVASVLFGVANGAVQVAGELEIAEREAQLERFAALEQSEINSQNDMLLDANSEALIKNLMLQLATLAIESQQAQLTLQQESIRLSQLYNELAQIERVYNDESAFASNRYYADPVHYLRVQESVQRARATFREAQDWIFFTARALEYKWNGPFQRTVGDRTWSIAELFRTRNSMELSQMLSAMELYDGAQSLGPGTGSTPESVSIREDLLGYVDLDNGGQPIFYVDPLSGESVRAITAFRSFLTENTVQRSNGDRALVFTFSTVTTPPGSQFFLPPEFDAAGNPTSLGTWLDKIQWMKLNVPGSHSRSGFVNGFLSDGGTQFIRNRQVGTFNPAQPDKVSGDATAYSSRIYFTTDGGETFEFRDALRVPIRLELDFPAGTTTMPNVPENTFFRERSVANSEWTLEVTIFDADGAPGGLDLIRITETDDIEIVINHRFSPRL